MNKLYIFLITIKTIWIILYIGVLMGCVNDHNAYYMILEYVFLITLGTYAIYIFNPWTERRITKNDKWIAYIMSFFVIWLLNYPEFYAIMNKQFGETKIFQFIDKHLGIFRFIFKKTNITYKYVDDTLNGGLSNTIGQIYDTSKSRYQVSRDLSEQNDLYNHSFIAMI